MAEDLVIERTLRGSAHTNGDVGGAYSAGILSHATDLLL